MSFGLWRAATLAATILCSSVIASVPNCVAPYPARNPSRPPEGSAPGKPPLGLYPDPDPAFLAFPATPFAVDPVDPVDPREAPAAAPCLWRSATRRIVSAMTRSSCRLVLRPGPAPPPPACFSPPPPPPPLLRLGGGRSSRPGESVPSDARSAITDAYTPPVDEQCPTKDESKT